MAKKIIFLTLLSLMILSCATPVARSVTPTTPALHPATPAGGLTATPPPTLATPAADQPARRHADSYAASVSGNGRYVVYQSSAGDLIDRDLPGCPQVVQRTASQPCQQVYRYDRQARRTELVSANPQGEPGNGASGAAKLSADGRFVVFSSYATNLVATGGDGASPGLFISDQQARAITQVAQDAANPAISADGRYIVYEKGAIATGVSNIYLYNRVTGLETQTSRPDPAAAQNPGPPGSSDAPTISADGAWVAFWSWDGHLTPNDGKMCGNWNCGDVFLYDRIQQQLTRIPMDAPWGVGMTFYPLSLSSDGRWLATANLLYDRSNGQTTRTQLTGGKISADGYWLIATRGPQVFVQAIDQPDLEQATVSAQGTPADGPLVSSVACMGPPQCQFKTSFDFSDNARFVVFDSTADNLDGPDPYLCAPAGVVPHNCADIFIRDRQARTTTWVSKPVRPGPAAPYALPDVTAQPITSLERTADITRSQPGGSAVTMVTEQVWYQQPYDWRFETRSNPAQPREPAIDAGDGKTLWRYNPGNNTLTLLNAPIQPSQPDRQPALFGSAEKVNTLKDFVTRIRPCYANPVYLGPGDEVAGRATYVFYLGRAACASSDVRGAGPETLWLDQQTLLTLRRVVQSPQSALPIYALTVKDVKYNPAIAPSRFNPITVPGALVVDQRK